MKERRPFIEALAFEANEILANDMQLEAVLSEQSDAVVSAPGMPAHYYRLLYKAASIFTPAIMVELGTSYGIGAACMADGNPFGTVITVDVQNLVWERCKRANVAYLSCDSLSPDFISDIMDGSVGMLFVDTDHDGARPLAEFMAMERKLSADAVVFFDDVSLNQKMADFWGSFNPDGWEKFDLPSHGGAGFGCLVRK